MAVFMTNNCKFGNCGANFDNVGDLIYHIECTHIDNDPNISKQKLCLLQTALPSIPMSYVLRFFPKSALKDLNINENVDPIVPPQSLTEPPAGKEIHEEDQITSPSDDSDDSWTQNGQFTSDYILKYGKKMTFNAADKRFVCPVPGCEKRYKNINGIKYHSKNGHKIETKPQKNFKCHCGKSYKTMPGLKAHSASHQSEVQAIPTPPIPSPMTPQRLDAFTPPSPYKNYQYPSNINTKFIRAALEGVLPPFNVLQNSTPSPLASEYSGYVDNLGILTPAASPRPLSADRIQYPNTMIPINPGYYPRTPIYGNYDDAQHYAVSNSNMFIE